jgi:hypothetical protein
MESCIQGHGGASGGDSAEVGGDPTRVIVGEDGNAGAGRKAVLGEPAADGFRHLPQLRVGVALDPAALLDLQGNVGRPTGGTFEEKVVESRHAGDGEILHEDVARPQ